jgi:hypothetical protein
MRSTIQQALLTAISTAANLKIAPISILSRQAHLKLNLRRDVSFHLTLFGCLSRKRNDLSRQNSAKYKYLLIFVMIHYLATQAAYVPVGGAECGY